MDEQIPASAPQTDSRPFTNKPKSKSNWVKVFLVGFGLGILAGLIYTFLIAPQISKQGQESTKVATSSAKKATSSDEKQNEKVPAATQKDETADWKTFTNSTFKYSLKYPDPLNVFSNSAMGEDTAETSGDVIFTNDPAVKPKTGGFESTIGKDFYLLQIYVINKNENTYYTGKTLADIIQGDYNKNKTSAESITELTQITFAGKSAYTFQKTKASAFDYLAGGWVLSQENIKVTEVENNGSIFYIIYRPNETIEKMLTTFKFL